MPMGRYLCQLCYSIGQYGEKHPCFFYKNDDEVYTVPPPNEQENMERKDMKPKEIHTGNLNDNNRNTYATVQKSFIEGSHETTSLLFEHNEQISLMTTSRRKRSRLSLKPPKFLRITKSGHSLKKSKNCRKIESASAVVPQNGNGSTSEMAPNSAAFGPVPDAASVFVAGPSGVKTHTLRTKKTFACAVCEKAFAKRCHLEEHERTHTGDKPFVCRTCGKGFSLQGNLTTHLLTHTGEKLFECDICGRRFALKHQLQRHVRTHTGEKPFKCEWCGKDFARQSDCSRHQKRKHGRK